MINNGELIATTAVEPRRSGSQPSQPREILRADVAVCWNCDGDLGPPRAPASDSASAPPCAWWRVDESPCPWTPAGLSPFLRRQAWQKLPGIRSGPNVLLYPRPDYLPGAAPRPRSPTALGLRAAGRLPRSRRTTGRLASRFTFSRAMQSTTSIALQIGQDPRALTEIDASRAGAGRAPLCPFRVAPSLTVVPEN